MEHASRHGLITALSSTRQAVAASSEYAASAVDGRIRIWRLNHQDAEPRHLELPDEAQHGNTVLAVSSHHTLAASAGTIAYIYDLRSGAIEHVVRGNGRTITCISFSHKDATQILTGHVGGGICLWSLTQPGRPLQQLVASSGACLALEPGPSTSDYLVSNNDGDVFLWNLARDSTGPICVLGGGKCRAVAWRPVASPQLAVLTAVREIQLYDVTAVTSAQLSSPAFHVGKEESDGETLEQADEANRVLQPLSRISLPMPLASIAWHNSSIMIGIAESTGTIALFKLDYDAQSISELWSCKFHDEVSSVWLDLETGTAGLVGITGDGFERRDVPQNIVEQIGRRTQEPGHTLDLSVDASDGSSVAPLGVTSSVRPNHELTSPTMSPLSVAAQHRGATPFAMMSKQLRQFRLLPRRRIRSRTLENKTGADGDRRSSSPSLRSSFGVEIPASTEENDFGSPMPFLSPGIPSRNISPNDLTIESSVGEPASLHDPIMSSSPATLIPPFNRQDSDDSDDETLIHGMHGSAAFLPGGINVPLPKACGALFAPNGQLLTFFPPKSKLTSTQAPVQEGEPGQRRSEDNKIAKLFQTFGNMQADSEQSYDSTDSEDTASSPTHSITSLNLPRLSFQPASFPSQLSWRSRQNATYSSFNGQQSEHKIVVSVHEIEDVPALYPAQRKTAAGFRLCCELHQSPAGLCKHNASVATSHNMREVAQTWQLLAMLLENQICNESKLTDATVVVGLAQQLIAKDGRTAWRVPIPSDSFSPGVGWADHPFGKAWLIRQILTWSECHGDVQSFALISRVLSEADARISTVIIPPEKASPSLPRTRSHDRSTEGPSLQSNRTTQNTIPILRTHAATITSLHDAPTKRFRSANHSSRTRSQQSAPHLESESTPPSISPLLSRQGTRLSTPGSVSPELQRGSFGAAAKYYAQSITDKLASYGTSPPFQKFSTSPNASNELSSSLPSGSWLGKSVSFASTASGDAKQRTHSMSVQGASYDEDGYDSDKTIEDTSTPHTPRSPDSVAAVNLHNQEYLVDDKLDTHEGRLIPEDSLQKIALCKQYYGELLRSWGLHLQAGELEKEARSTCGSLPPSDCVGEPCDGITPMIAAGKQIIVCNICFTVAGGVFQICPTCLHSTHLACLECYVADQAGQAFECPSGCGCPCSELPYSVQVLSQRSPQRPAFKKKSSFTDPRTWRARVEGDSW